MDTALNVRLGAKTAEFNKKLKQSSYKLRKLGNQVKSIGASITRNFSVPFALAGGASIKMSLDFDKSMTRINTLVRGTSGTLAELKNDVLAISGETAKSPVELADGLYFLESAGLRGSNALETLTQVAKGSASGLGDMESLSVVAAAAQNAYGQETLSASDALDKFGVMVRTGMFDAQELSQVLGRQLGLASSLGISFDEVGAMISTFTATTGDATSATNGLSAVMMTLAKLEAEPTKQQEEALEKIKMTAGDVKTMLGEEGLQGTLLTLQQKFNENGIAMASFFGKSQALKTVLGVLGEQSEKYVDTLESMEQSQNFVGDAFAVTAEQDFFKMQKALNDIKISATQFGNTLAPIVSLIAERITSLTEKFMALSDTQKTNIARILGTIAVAGPLVKVIGSLILGFRNLRLFVAKYEIAQKLATAAIKVFNLVTKLNPLGLLLTGIAALVVAFQQLKGKTSETAVAFTNFFRKVYNGMVAFVNEVIKSFNSIGKYIGIEIQPLKKVELAVADIKDTTDETTNSLSDLEKELGKIGNLDLGGGDDATPDPVGGGGDGEEDEQAEKERIRKENTALQNIRRLRQQFGLLNIKDADQRRLQELKNQMENDLLAVEETKHAEDEKMAIRNKYGKQIELLNKKISDNAISEYDRMVKKITEITDSVLNVVSQITNALGGLFDAQNKKANQLFENEKAREQEAYDNWYNTQLAKIEQTAVNEEEKNALIEQLDENAAVRKTEMDNRIDEQEKTLRRKQAQRDKDSAIMGAIMNTAQAITKALTLGLPLGPIMATFVGGLGAAQIATIRSTPLPKLAEGGIAFGATIAQVGEYPGASANPEVIAPLDKLRNLMGNHKQELYSKIRGNDIFLANDLAIMNRVRFT